MNTALKKKSSIVITTQKVSEVEAPGFKASLPRSCDRIKFCVIFEMPGGNTTVILQSNGPKVNLDEITATRPYLQGKVSLIEEDMQVEKSDEMKALMDTCRELSTKYVEASERMSPDTAFAIKNLDEPEILVNFICTNFPFSQEDRYALLCINNLKDRLYRLIQVLNKEVQLATLKQNIQMRTREDLDRQQREYFLQQQIKNIQDELGNGQNDEVEELREKASHKKWRREVAKLSKRSKQTWNGRQPAVSGLQRAATYLQTLLALPWDVYTDDVINIPNAEKVLNKDHYGLEKVKERILEHLAVLKLKNDLKSPIICLYGPPGVGKTSLGRSIAAALKRKYVRMSLGGVHDEAEIRGHRKTYIGAMPGRIIKSLIKAETSNPVIILDEIDKLGSDHRGDPSSAMLEVLDPEHSGINLFDEDWKIYSRNSGMPGHKICAGASVENSMITDGCKIAGSVKHSILFAGVKVEAGAVVEDAVVMGRTTIKAGASVKHCIVAENVVIGENAVVGAMPTEDEQGVATIGPDVCVGTGAKIGPNAMISEDVKDGEEK